MMLQHAGFGRLRAEGGSEHAEPARDSGILVFIAHKPPGLTIPAPERPDITTSTPTAA